MDVLLAIKTRKHEEVVLVKNGEELVECFLQKKEFELELEEIDWSICPVYITDRKMALLSNALKRPSSRLSTLQIVG